MNFLQLLHHKAEQSITALCRGSVVYYDSRNKDYNSAANLLLFNGKVINTHLDRRVRGEGGFVELEVNVKDDCMVSFHKTERNNIIFIFLKTRLNEFSCVHRIVH